MNFDTFKTKYNIRSNLLEYTSLLKAVKLFWHAKVKSDNLENYPIKN